MRMMAGSCLLNVPRALRMLHSAVLSSVNPTKKGGKWWLLGDCMEFFIFSDPQSQIGTLCTLRTQIKQNTKTCKPQQTTFYSQ